jgi:hypothetical protein
MAKNVVGGAVEAINHGTDQVQGAMAPGAKRSGLWNLGMLFIILTLVFMFLFWLLKLPIVLKAGPAGTLSGTPSFWKVLGSGAVASAVVILLIWIASKLTGSK